MKEMLEMECAIRFCEMKIKDYKDKSIHMLSGAQSNSQADKKEIQESKEYKDTIGFIQEWTSRKESLKSVMEKEIESFIVTTLIKNK